MAALLCLSCPALTECRAAGQGEVSGVWAGRLLARPGVPALDLADPGDLAAAERFTEAVDAGTVVVNASTRFTDGAEFGFGAEIGISTQKLHARGPMALRELTTYKYVVWGDGQIRD